MGRGFPSSLYFEAYDAVNGYRQNKELLYRMVKKPMGGAPFENPGSGKPGLLLTTLADRAGENTVRLTDCGPIPTVDKKLPPIFP
jgi:hypothetical protein